MEHPKAIIIRDAPAPPSEEMGEEFPMDEFIEIEEDTPTYDGDSIPALPQLPLQQGNVEASAPTRTSSRRWKAPTMALESREQESLYLNKAYIAIKGEQKNQQYYEAMHQED